MEDAFDYDRERSDLAQPIDAFPRQIGGHHDFPNTNRISRARVAQILATHIGRQIEKAIA
jgi:hypothetical protein